MKKQKILVIDDNRFWLQYIARQLKKEDYEVVLHTNAVDAVDDIDSSVDGIIVDLLLGYNTVFPLLHELKSDDEVADVPIIVCSSTVSTIPIDALKNYGVRVALDKTTMHPEDITVAIKKIMQ